MKTKFKILSFVALLFLVSVIFVSSASAGFNIYPEGTEVFTSDIFGFPIRPHWALVYDIEPELIFNDNWHPRVTLSPYAASWMPWCSEEHKNPQDWTFMPSEKYEGMTAVMIPTTYCMYYGYNPNYGVRLPSLTIRDMDRENSIWLDTNHWYPCAT